MRTLKIINEFINMHRDPVSTGTTLTAWHPVHLQWGPLSCGRAAPSLPLRMCEPGDGERNVDVWGWQTRVCLRVCTKMM